MARIINNTWEAPDTIPAGKTITNYSLENNGVELIEVGNVLVANGVNVPNDLEINTRVRAKYNDGTYGDYSNVQTIPEATVTFVLDQYPNWDGVGFAKLRELATLCCRVRRSSDNALCDVILEASGEIQLSSSITNLSAGSGATLGAWLSTDDGFIHTMYSQKATGGVDFVRTTLARQPYIARAGVLTTSGGKTAMDFEAGGVRRDLERAVFVTDNIWTIVTVAELGDILGAQTLLGQHTGAATPGRTQFISVNSGDLDQKGFFANNLNAGSGFTAAPDWAAGRKILVRAAYGNNYYSAENSGTLIQDASGATDGIDYTPLNAAFKWGSQASSNHWSGFGQELLLAPTDEHLDVAAIVTHRNTEWATF